MERDGLQDQLERLLRKPRESAASQAAPTVPVTDVGKSTATQELQRLLGDGRVVAAVPADWVADGSSLRQGNQALRPLVARIGVDFGTSFSKIAIHCAGVIFPVDFRGLGNETSKYWLPTSLVKAADEALAPVQKGNAPSTFSNLKLQFIGVGHVPNDVDRARAVIYLAWLMLYARSWLYRFHGTLVEGARLVWEMNVGAPTGSWASSKGLRSEYLRIAMAAWKLSQADVTFSLVAAAQMLKDTHPQQEGHGLDHLDIVPEFAAQVAIFRISKQRRDRVYVLVDVGAGTVDIACFRLFYDSGDNEDRLPVLASAVRPLGTHLLMDERLTALGATDIDWPDSEPVPSAQEIARKANGDLATIQRCDRSFCDKVVAVIRLVVSDARRKKDPRSRDWLDSIPVFLVGGGAKVGVYQVALREALSHNLLRCHLVSLLSPAKLSRDVALDETSLGRLSVAVGLTADSDALGRLIPPGDIPDLKLSPPPDRPDRDDLYPK